MIELKTIFSAVMLHLTGTIIGTIFLLLAATGLWVVSRQIKKYEQLNPTQLLIIAVVEHLKKPLLFFIPVLLLQIILPLIIPDEALLEFDRILQLLMIAAFSWLLIATVYIGEDWLKFKYNVDKIDNIRERRIRTSILFIKRLIIILIVIFALGFILMSFQNVRKLGTGILASAGIAGIIIGIAAQKSLANILAGLQIAFTQPIRIDDVLVVEGEWGRVEEITLTFVVIRIWDQRRLILPINYFLEKPFQNWTRRTAELLGTVFIYTDYSVDINSLRTELTNILKNTPLWDGKVNLLQVSNASEKTLELRALVSTRNSSDSWDLRCLVREKLLDYIKKNCPQALPKFRIDHAHESSFSEHA